MATSQFDLYVNRGKTPLQRELIENLKLLTPELWYPVKVFPRYEYEKEGKMKYAFTPYVKDDNQLMEFKSLVKDYLLGLDLEELFVPPPDLVLKVSSSRYNDGGTVRRDYEKPKISFNSGFLYQKFSPKPLEPREVWLPDMATKINNSFWMLIGRQILKKDETYPDSDPMVTWEKIRKDLTWFGYFDISGFGFQYPRELLVVVAETIVELYNSPDMEEFLLIFKRLMSSVKVQMPDGKFVYPPRGIGLGYYEDLKTIGMNAILKRFKPISVYGDQGLIPFKQYEESIKELKRFQFIIADDKHKLMRGVIRWSGWIQTPYVIKRPKQVFEPLTSLFHAQYHWERKMILRSIYKSNPFNYDKYDMILPFQYELFFGYEVSKGDSLWNFQNGGVSSRTLRRTGLVKGWAYEKLVAPTDTINDSVFYESPFFTEWKRRDSKHFSIKRKNVYKNSIPSSTDIRDYATPIYSLNRSKEPRLSRLAGLLSDSQESKLVVNHLMTSGKLNFGLSYDDMLLALRQCSVARNPFEAYATGGLSIDTVYRPHSIPSKEWIEFIELLATNISYMNSNFVHRYDTRNPPISDLKPTLTEHGKEYMSIFDKNRKRPLVSNEDIRKKKSIYRITVDMISSNSKDFVNPDTPKNASSLLGDINLRSIDFKVDETFSCEDESVMDMDYLLDSLV